MTTTLITRLILSLDIPARYIRSIAIPLATSIVLAGCRSNGPDPRIYTTITPPIKASALSNGKITGFIPMPGLENDSDNAELLTAAGLSNIQKGSVARKGFITFQSRTGNNLLGCLVIGKDVLVVLGDFVRQAFGEASPGGDHGSLVVLGGPPYNGKPFYFTKPGMWFINPNSEQYIALTPNEKTALVGGKRIKLSHPMTRNGVVFLSDLLRLLHERDRQLGPGVSSVRNVKIIYDIRDYHR